MPSQYYAVVTGRQPGIYLDWDSTNAQVKGYPGAIFKSFRTRREAEAFLKQCTSAAAIPVVAKPATLPLHNKTIIYCDGSYVPASSHNPESTGIGIVAIPPSGKKLIAYGRVPERLGATNNIAELYAIYVALSLVSGDVQLYTDSQYAISCLTSYIHAWQANGWRGVSNRELLEGCYEKMSGRSISFTHVNGHTGVELNEEADRLAKRGHTLKDELIVEQDGRRVWTLT